MGPGFVGTPEPWGAPEGGSSGGTGVDGMEHISLGLGSVDVDYMEGVGSRTWRLLVQM